MNRKSFLRNLFGTVIATAIGSNLDFITEVQNKGVAKQVKYITMVDAYGNTWQFVYNPLYDDPQPFSTPSIESYRMVFLDFSKDM